MGNFPLQRPAPHIPLPVCVTVNACNCLGSAQSAACSFSSIYKDENHDQIIVNCQTLYSEIMSKSNKAHTMMYKLQQIKSAHIQCQHISTGVCRRVTGHKGGLNSPRPMWRGSKYIDCKQKQYAHASYSGLKCSLCRSSASVS